MASYYLDFSDKYNYRADEESSLPPFIEKLASKQLSFVESKGEYRRCHVQDSEVQKAVKEAGNL